jgi:hypothetical protein
MIMRARLAVGWITEEDLRADEEEEEAEENPRLKKRRRSRRRLQRLRRERWARGSDTACHAGKKDDMNDRTCIVTGEARPPRR